MAHYAFIDENNLVTEVIVGKDENEDTPDGYDSWEDYYLTKRPDADACKRTSYNTSGNQHLADGTAFRGNYAGIGYSYDATDDVFIAPQPYDSWTLNSNYLWEPPVAYPDDGEIYVWNESTQTWDLA